MRGAMAAFRALTVAVATALAPPAAAGAWPRDLGAWFLSTAVVGWRDPSSGSAALRSELYLDYGLGGGWILGAEGSLGPGGGGDLLVGAYRAVPWPTGRAVMRWGVALGRRRAPGGGETTILRPDLAWGRGWGAGPMRWSGWTQVELQAEIWPGRRKIAPKVEWTFGLNPTARWTVMLQIRGDAYPGAPRKLRLVPGVVRRLSPHMRLAVSPGLTVLGGHDADIKIALWTEF